jgi:hypothetical protein
MQPSADNRASFFVRDSMAGGDLRLRNKNVFSELGALTARIVRAGVSILTRSNSTHTPSENMNNSRRVISTRENAGLGYLTRVAMS